MKGSLWLVAVSITTLWACEKAEVKEAPATGQAATQMPGVNEALITAAALVALPAPGLGPFDLPDPQSNGAKDVASFCSQCHNIPSPAAHAATDWPSVARRMWLRIDLLPPTLALKVPTIQERQAMLEYLITNSLKVSGSSLPEGPGRSAFSETCSRCHALPDPRQHSPADWPSVVLRMGQHMDQLKVSRPTPAVTQQIVAYLSNVASARKPPKT